MKKLLLICLMAGCGQCFAQNLELKDLQNILEAPTVEYVNQLLAPKGYSLSGKMDAQVWGFKSDMHSEAAMIAQLYRVSDTAGIKLIYETANPFFYTNLLNQLLINNYLFKQTAAANDQISLIFSNGRLELLLDLVHDTDVDNPYRITLRPVNPLRTILKQQYNHQQTLQY